MSGNNINFETERVSSLYLKILVPTLLGCLSITAVTAIDGILIGHGVGADGIAAVNIVVPVYQIVSGVGLMIGVGCSVVSSILLSRQSVQMARINVSQAIYLSSVFMLLACALVMFFPSYTARLLGSSETLLPQVVDYLIWIMPCFVFQMWSLIGLFVIRLDGSPRYAMWCNIIPAIMNAVLDWVFIFPLGMGVKGAAIATSLSISFGGVMALIYLLFYGKTLRLVPFRVSAKSIFFALRNLSCHCKIGLSTFLGELSLGVFFFVGNLVFMHYLGDAGVGAFGIACYYAPVFFMMGNGISQSAQPIISYNYGMSKMCEINKARQLLLQTSILTGVVITIPFIAFPQLLVSLFVDANSDAGIIAVNGFPLFAVGILFFILNVAVIGYYQSVKQIKMATLLMILRGVLFLIPFFVFLPMVLETHGIWLAMPLAEIFTTFIIVSLVFRSYVHTTWKSLL